MFNPENPDKVFNDLTDPALTLRDIADIHNTSLEYLTLWMSRPDNAARLDHLQSAIARRTRLIALNYLPLAVETLRSTLAGHNDQELNTPFKPDCIKTREFQRRSRETARKAAALLQRLAHFDTRVPTRPNDPDLHALRALRAKTGGPHEDASGTGTCGLPASGANADYCESSPHREDGLDAQPAGSEGTSPLRVSPSPPWFNSSPRTPDATRPLAALLNPSRIETSLPSHTLGQTDRPCTSRPESTMQLPRILAALAIGLSASFSASCASHHHKGSSAAHAPAAAPAAPPAAPTMDKTQQQAMTPDQALARLAAGNQRFVSGSEFYHDYAMQRQATSEHQYPFAVVLACIDSRSSPEIIFDQGIGDLFVPRVAGNYATPDILGSMEYSTKVAGAKAIVVLGHTECGAVKGACDNIQMGNLTTVIQAIRPAVDDVKDVPTDRNSKNHHFVTEVTENNVRRTVAKIRSDSEIIRGLETAGQIKIVGAIYDIDSGRVTFLN